jgi:hypothetical protein
VTSGLAATGDPCAAPSVVAPVCDAATREWVCPNGARLYARVVDAPPTCLPFRHAHGISSVGQWGLGAFARVPTDDGRCLWIAESATLSDGTKARNVAFEPDPNAPFGTCPDESLTTPTPIVTVDGGDDPDILVQIDRGYRLGGATHVLYRLFRLDSTAVFGVTEMGGGIARWDPQTQRIVVPSPASPFPWHLDLDLGDATLAAGDGEHELVWGCAQRGMFLEQGCELARLDADGAVELYSKSGSWIRGTDASKGATLFGSGPWASSVIVAGSGLLHVYIGDFGSELQTHVASAATGPWSSGASLGACDLPSDDPKAFCAAPIVHLELADPTRPGELPITYGIGGSGAAAARKEAYWARLVWVH